MRIRHLLVALSLAGFQAMSLCAQGTEAVSNRVDCPGPPPGAQPLEYKVLFAQTQRATGGPAEASPVEQEPRLAVREHREIRDEAEYVRIFGSDQGLPTGHTVTRVRA